MLVSSIFLESRGQKMSFPSEKELKKVRKSLAKSPGIKIISSKASKVDRIKFDICLKFLKYSEERGLSQKELATILSVDEAIMSKVLRCRVESFTLDRLLRYFEIIHPNYKFELAS
jgi:predicted XRE-type DNA-binding protein